MKTSSKRSKRRDLQLKWLLRETNDIHFWLSFEFFVTVMSTIQLNLYKRGPCAPTWTATTHFFLLDALVTLDVRMQEPSKKRLKTRIFWLLRQPPLARNSCKQSWPTANSLYEIARQHDMRNILIPGSASYNTSTVFVMANYELSNCLITNYLLSQLVPS